MPQLPGVQAETSENNSNKQDFVVHVWESLQVDTVTEPRFWNESLSVLEYIWRRAGGAELFLFHVFHPAGRRAAGRFLCAFVVIVSPFMAADAGGWMRRPLAPDWYLSFTVDTLSPWLSGGPNGSLASLFRQTSVVSQGCGSCTLCNNLAELHRVWHKNKKYRG